MANNKQLVTYGRVPVITFMNNHDEWVVVKLSAELATQLVADGWC